MPLFLVLVQTVHLRGFYVAIRDDLTPLLHQLLLGRCRAVNLQFPLLEGGSTLQFLQQGLLGAILGDLLRLDAFFVDLEQLFLQRQWRLNLVLLLQVVG